MTTFRHDAPGGLDRAAYEAAISQIRDEIGERAAAVAELAREFGLRSKEASLLDARSALVEARQRGAVTIRDGTKGGREREVPITDPVRQIPALEAAAAAQGDARSLVPPEQSWAQWREGELRDARDLVRAATGGGIHDLRAAYACARYDSMTGHPAPAAGGTIADRAADEAARREISRELGHNRIEVVAEYVGGRH